MCVCVCVTTLGEDAAGYVAIKNNDEALCVCVCTVLRASVRKEELIAGDAAREIAECVRECGFFFYFSLPPYVDATSRDLYRDFFVFKLAISVPLTKYDVCMCEGERKNRNIIRPYSPFFIAKCISLFLSLSRGIYIQ